MRRRGTTLTPCALGISESLQAAYSFGCSFSARQQHSDASLCDASVHKKSVNPPSSQGECERNHNSHEPWREWLTLEQLQGIDTLTYLLGRYPPLTQTAATESNNESSAPTIKASVSGKVTSLKSEDTSTNSNTNSAPASSKTTLKVKKNKLAALNARAVPTTAVNATAPSPSSNCIAQCVGGVGAKQPSRLWAQPSTLTSSSLSSAAASKGPFTAAAEAERLARAWLQRDGRVQKQQARVEATAEAAWQALLKHPAHLFNDDAAVYERFGMGGYVSPQLPGFTGLFRQRWQDFHVTEMAMPSEKGRTREQKEHNKSQKGSSTHAGAAPVAPSVQKGMYCDAVPVSRDFDFSIPPLPNELLFESAETPTGEEQAKGSDAADLSFFAVDVKQRIQELQAEEVSKKDLVAVAAALAKEEKQHRLTGTADPVSPESDNNSHLSAVLKSDLTAPVASAALRSASQNLLSEHSHQATSTAGSVAVDEHGSNQGGSGSRNFLQCTLHKQHLAHGNALAAIAQTLRIHPHSISVAGIKDYVGDTVQRVRLERVSPASALAANRRFRQKGLKMTLSDFSYEAGPLAPGDLFGNHFRVVLRDVDVPTGDLSDAIAAFAEKGFPNYYGCQRFSWFAGRQDAAFALLRHNWLAFAFLFLNYTAKDRSLRELLQRPKKYPHPSQDEYRRGVVRRLRSISIEPADLDVAPFLSCPALNAPLTHVDGRPFSEVEELICAQLREAYFDLNVQSRRLTAQRLSSYLWNQVLTLRLHHIGGEAVLDGDVVAPASIRQLSTDVGDRQDWYHTFGDRVSPDNRHRYTIDDVVHPGFSFDAITLPDNVVGAYYEQICGKYALDWMAQHSRSGLRDFREPARPIIRKPLNLSYDYNPAARVLTLRFALERGCYANVALSELMKSVRCLGSEAVTLLPLPEVMWDALGEVDRGYVTTLQDIYEGYEDGVGFMNDDAPVALAAESETKVWDHDGPLFRPAKEDPFRKAHRWGSQHLLRNSERREKEAEDMKRMLFDRPLAKQLREGEVDTYAGHIVPLPPNASAKAVYAKVMQRKRRYAGSPKTVTRMRRSTSPSSHRGGGGSQATQLPSFQSLNKNSWNFTW